MKNNKGFTLIELLAVIVILAIIALIATPIVLNALSEATKGAAKDSGYGYIKSVEQSITTKMLSEPSMSLSGTFTYTAANAGTYTYGTGENAESVTLTIDHSGTSPTAASLTFVNGKITTGTMTIRGVDLTVEANGEIKEAA